MKFQIKSILAAVSIFFLVATQLNAQAISTDLKMSRTEPLRGLISYNFRYRVEHLEADQRCTHILKLKPRALNSDLGRQREVRRIGQTTSSSLVRWRVQVPAAKRTDDTLPELHAIVTSICGSEIIDSNVASKYACSSTTSAGISISTQVKLIARNARVSKKSI